MRERFPKYKNQKLDPISQAKFRRYKNIIVNSIQMTDDTIPKKRIDVIAWNCAYEILTNPYENREEYMGYELPTVVDFEFLGKKYKAISF